eukprot:11574938-Alexandrium_andersonii.AAC.1
MTGSPTFADSESRRGQFGPFGELGRRPPRAGSGEASLTSARGPGDCAVVPTSERRRPLRVMDG